LRVGGAGARPHHRTRRAPTSLVLWVRGGGTEGSDNIVRSTFNIRRLAAPQRTGEKCQRRSLGLLNHLIGTGEQHGRYLDAKHPGGVGVDDQLELRRLHDRQVRGFAPLRMRPA
jgi:hypothetical protein